MPTVSDVAARLSPIVAGAASWDQVGLQLGDPSEPVEGIGVCHEVTDEVIDRATTDGIGLLVAYHPLLFSPTTRLVAGPTPTGRAHRLVRAGVSLFVVHTGWDAHPGGTADALADALGLADVRPFGADDGAAHLKVVTFVPQAHVAGLIDALAGAGAGTIGEYASCAFTVPGHGTFEPGPGTDPHVGEVGLLNRVEEQRVEMILPLSRRESVVRALLEAHPYEEPAFDLISLQPDTIFIGRVGTVGSPTLGELTALAADRLGFAGVRMAGDAARRVASVAVVPGSGSSFSRAARSAGADVLVTGDVGHHRAVEALDSGLAVIDVGHAPGERPGVARLYDVVASHQEVPVHDYTDTNTNPWESM